jgi:serine/threonine protein kinase
MNQRYQLMEPRGSRNNSETIGEGAYGVVYKALDRSTSKFVALKKIRVETEFDGISPSTLREITLLMQMNHENVVKLENVVMDKERMSLIFELMDSDLKKYLDQTNAPLPLETIRVRYC